MGMKNIKTGTLEVCGATFEVSDMTIEPAIEDCVWILPPADFTVTLIVDVECTGDAYRLLRWPLPCDPLGAEN